MIYTKEQMDEIKEMPSILKLLNPYIQKLPHIGTYWKNYWGCRSARNGLTNLFSCFIIFVITSVLTAWYNERKSVPQNTIRQAEPFKEALWTGKISPYLPIFMN